MLVISEYIKSISILLFLIIVYRLVKNLCKEFSNIEKKEVCNTRKTNKKVILNIISIATFSRIAILTFGYLTQILFTEKILDFVTSMQYCWLKWDGLHYLNIAQNWYLTTGGEKYLIVFYPLYPILIKIVNSTGINDFFISGMIISNVCLIISAVFLYKLALLDFDHKTSMRSVKYLLIYPFSFCLNITYSDSLFLCLTLISFYLLRKKKWVQAGIVGGLSSACRSFGVLILVPALVEYLLESNILEYIKQKDFLTIKKLLYRAWFLFLFPLGVFIYYYMCKTITGDWFISVKYLEEHWTTKFGLFPQNIQTLFFGLNSNPIGLILLWGPQFLVAFLTLIFIYYSITKLKISYSIYMLLYWLLIFSLTHLLGASRYIVGMFPVYILLGIISKNKTVDFILTGLFSFLLCFYTIAFIKGHFLI